jgi:hypothetical protein
MNKGGFGCPFSLVQECYERPTTYSSLEKDAIRVKVKC